MGKIANALARWALPRATGKSFDQLVATLQSQAIPAWGPSYGPDWTSETGRISTQLKANVGWVYSCVGAIQRRVSAVPILVQQERAGQYETLDSHPLVDLLLKPNPYMSGVFFWQLVESHLDLAGGAMIHMIANGRGVPAELWPLPIDRLIKIESGGTNKDWITGYRFRTASGGEHVYAPEEVLYVRFPNPHNPLYPCSPIQAQAYAYDIDKAFRVYHRQFFQNSARPDVVLSTEQTLNPDVIKRILIAWKQDHQGLGKAHLPAILEGGLKAAPLTATAKDAEFMALAGWSKDNILAAYGVPEGKLGLVKDVNRANAQGIDITFNSECIHPRLMLWDGAINNQLTPRFGSGLWVEHENPVPRDDIVDHQQMVERIDRGIITVNEARADLGLDPVDGGDEPTIAAGRVPLAMAGQAVFTSSSYQGPPPQTQPPTDNQAPPKALKAPAKRRRIVRISAERQAQEQTAGADHFEPALVEVFGEMKADTLSRIEAGYKRLDSRFAGWSKGKIEATLKAEPPDDLVFVADDYTGPLWQDVYKPRLTTTLAKRGFEIVGQMDIGTTFNVEAPGAVDFLQSREFLMVETVDDIRARTMELVQQGIRDGLGTDDVARLVRDYFDSLSNPPDIGGGLARSRRIAETETGAALNAADQLARAQAVDMGFSVLKTWHAQPNARPTHAAAAARYGSNGIPEYQPFIVGGASCQHPGACGVAAEDINCHCWTNTVLIDQGV